MAENRWGLDHGGLTNSRKRNWTSFLGPVKVAASFEQRRFMAKVVWFRAPGLNGRSLSGGAR